MKEEQDKIQQEEMLNAAGQDEAAQAMLEEKDDMIEQLKGELESKREELAEAQRGISDLQEELEILQKRQLAVTCEKDLL